MVKTWGKDIWEKKSLNQKGITVSRGVVGLLLGKERYLNYLNKRKNCISSFLKKHKEEILLHHKEECLAFGKDIPLVTAVKTYLRGKGSVPSYRVPSSSGPRPG